jgi:hypothetical protein
MLRISLIVVRDLSTLCLEVRGMNLKGTLPTLILEALEHQRDHGYSIAQLINERSSGVLDSAAAVATAMGTPTEYGIPLLLVTLHSEGFRNSIRRKLPVERWPRQLFYQSLGDANEGRNRFEIKDANLEGF